MTAFPNSFWKQLQPPRFLQLGSQQSRNLSSVTIRRSMPWRQPKLLLMTSIRLQQQHRRQPPPTILTSDGYCFHTNTSRQQNPLLLRLNPPQKRHLVLPKQQPNLPHRQVWSLFCHRTIQTETEYSHIADQALETIQDAVDSLFDRQTLIEYEISLSAGVLTMKFPPHGTWVINKQTPNLQIWVRNCSCVEYYLVWIVLSSNGDYVM
jgi:Frataxin-like domain